MKSAVRFFRVRRKQQRRFQVAQYRDWLAAAQTMDPTAPERAQLPDHMVLYDRDQVGACGVAVCVCGVMGEAGSLETRGL